MKSDLYNTFINGFSSGAYIRLGENKDLSLYVGKDDSNNYSFEFRGRYTPVKISNSDVIIVTQFKTQEYYTLRFSLSNRDLLARICLIRQWIFERMKLHINNFVSAIFRGKSYFVLILAQCLMLK